MEPLTISELEAQLVGILRALTPEESTLHANLYRLWHAQLPGQQEVAEKSYSLLANLQEHAPTSPLAALFYSCLCGSAPLHALWRASHITRELEIVLSDAERVQLPDSARGQLPQAEVAQLLARLFPGAPDAQARALQGAVDVVSDGDCVEVARLLGWRPPAAVSISGENHHSQNTGLLPGAEGHAVSAAASAESAKEVFAPGSVCLLALRHYCENLQELRDRAQHALGALDDKHPSGFAPIGSMHAALASVENLSPSGQVLVQHVVERLRPAGAPFDGLGEVELERFVDLFKAVAPVQVQGDFDIDSARAWLRGLQAQAGGTTSLAELPDVV